MNYSTYWIGIVSNWLDGRVDSLSVFAGNQVFGFGNSTISRIHTAIVGITASSDVSLKIETN